jgi:hypothetical protein
MKRHRVFALLLSIFAATPRAAYADPTTTTAPAADAPSTGAEIVARPAPTYFTPLSREPTPLTVDPRVVALMKERDKFHRGIPITMIVVGGTVALVGVAGIGLAGLGAMSEEPNPSKPDFSGEYVAIGGGLALATAGIIWLVEGSRRNRELTRRIDELQREQHPVTVVPVFSPASAMGGVAVSGIF